MARGSGIGDRGSTRSGGRRGETGSDEENGRPPIRGQADIGKATGIRIVAHTRFLSALRADARSKTGACEGSDEESGRRAEIQRRPSRC
jgi:hypothetical protein